MRRYEGASGFQRFLSTFFARGRRSPGLESTENLILAIYIRLYEAKASLHEEIH